MSARFPEAGRGIPDEAAGARQNLSEQALPVCPADFVYSREATSQIAVLAWIFDFELLSQNEEDAYSFLSAGGFYFKFIRSETKYS
ncbi:MAG: hypothetical protein LUG99_05130 [Lachnospiraceae bacterium]|nr:hypothetical protein [Lachnospiraceae bacterium]